MRWPVSKARADFEHFSNRTHSKTHMKQEKTIGYLLIAGAIGVFIPYTILTITFEYPDILRQDAGTILTRFHNGGSSLIFTWWAFAILGLPLLIAYILIGQMFENKVGFIRWTTTIGVSFGNRPDHWATEMGICCTSDSNYLYYVRQSGNKGSGNPFLSNHSPAGRCFVRRTLRTTFYCSLDNYDFCCLY